MSKHKLIIQRAFLARTTGKIDYRYGFNDGKCSQSVLAEFEIVKEITAIVDEENQNVIDIETHEVFPIVKRDENRKIMDFNPESLNCKQLFALHLLDKDWDKISLLYQLELKSRAKKVYEEYLENRNKNNSGPILTKKKSK